MLLFPLDQSPYASSPTRRHPPHEPRDRHRRLRRISERDDVGPAQHFGGFLIHGFIRARGGSIGRRIPG
jgi:hypothetical protein